MTARALFVSDLHGRTPRYEKLLAAIRSEHPAAVFIGGDILPTGAFVASLDPAHDDFIRDYLAPAFLALRDATRARLPARARDPRQRRPALGGGGRSRAAPRACWEYVHDARSSSRPCTVYGYACVPPTPFLLKDWERYDVSRYVDPGCVSPEEGARSVPVDATRGALRHDRRGSRARSPATTISRARSSSSTRRRYQTPLDRAALDGKSVDHVPLDLHIGSIAIRRFIEARQPLITLHGHVHESARLTGRLARPHRPDATPSRGPRRAGARARALRPGPARGATRELI